MPGAGEDETRKAPSLVVTADGSVTLFNEDAGELYRNSAGAYTEALKNYVEPACAVDTLQRTGRLRVLDVCFGMGYNSFVLLQHLAEKRLSGQVFIRGIENDSAVHALASSHVLEDPRLQAARALLPATPVSTGAAPQVSSRTGLQVVLEVVLADLRHELPKLPDREEYDIVFHDPFSPRKVPQLWTVDIFRKYHQLLAARRGRVLTYSIAGAVRGGLLEAGFAVWRTTAVGGKYGGTLAMFPGDQPPPGCQPGEAGFGERKGGRRSLVPFRDPDFSATKDELLLRRSLEQADYEI
jgi:tRNA U34 5-methylaminomethyl-2-thiouridine-forming methyltransferase MnmC